MARIQLEGEGVVDKYPHLLQGNNTEGLQSMTRIKNLDLYNFAQAFVNIYLERGQDVAAQYAVDNAPAGGVGQAKDYVAMAFEKRGFVINKGA